MGLQGPMSSSCRMRAESSCDLGSRRHAGCPWTAVSEQVLETSSWMARCRTNCHAASVQGSQAAEKPAITKGYCSFQNYYLIAFTVHKASDYLLYFEGFALIAHFWCNMQVGVVPSSLYPANKSRKKQQIRRVAIDGTSGTTYFYSMGGPRFVNDVGSSEVPEFT
jgi:hypothetical protein